MEILIVDDSCFTALYLRKTLERMGHQVTTVPNGDDAWNLIETRRFRLIVSDWMMPGLDGLELCRRVRERLGDDSIYFMLLTSRTKREDRLNALQAGADDFLTKPIDVEELHARLNVARRILGLQDTLRNQLEELRRLSLSLAENNQKLSELATTDALTGLKNRRFFRELLDSNFALSSRTGLPLSLIMLDVDHFKQYNDSFGHPAGDVLLTELAGFLARAVREHDLAARHGGEEFVLLLPATDSRAARNVAERIRASIAEHPWDHHPVTASFGVATTDRDVIDAADLIEHADQALYHSKRSGRDRVTHSQDLETFGVLRNLDPEMKSGNPR